MREEKLFDAVRRGDLAEVERLLDAGADPVATMRISGMRISGWAPLHEACWRGHIHIARLLLDRGADVNARDIDGNTPLHVACTWGHHDTARLLIDRGSYIGVLDNAGRTPLDIACDLPESDNAREPLLEVFRDLAPEAYFTKFCESPGRMPGRGM